MPNTLHVNSEQTSKSVKLELVKHEDAMIRLLLADDHPMMLRGLKLTFEDEKDIKIVACVRDGEAILACLDEEEQEVHIVLTDILMPKLDGLQTVAKMLESKKYPKTHVIFYSMKVDEATVGQAIKMGVQGYLDKGCESDEILEAIRTIAKEGQSYFSKEVQALVPKAKKLMENMPSPREREVLPYLEQGFLAKEIADKLNISEHTTRDHTKNLRKKYGVNNIAELLNILRKKGII